MTHMQMQTQMQGHFYPYQAHHVPPQHLAQQQQQAQAHHQQMHAPPHHHRHALSPSEEEEAYMRSLVAMNQQHHPHMFQLQDYPQGMDHRGVEAQQQHQYLAEQRRTAASPLMIKYESPSLLPSQLPLLQE